MKKKQIIGLIAAAAVFIVTCSSSVLVNAISSIMTNAATGSMSGMFDTFGYDMPMTEDFVAVIPIEGTIQASGTETDGYYYGSYDHSYLMTYVDTLMEMENNVGIVLDIDTPGGTVYESDELYLKLMEYKETTGRPIYTYMNSYCCSGGYYIASASDEIYANRNTWTGSIGVIISTYNYAGLFEKIGVEEITIVSGDNKAMGHSGQAMTEEQRAIYQGLVDEAYEQFVGVVAEGRNMSESQVKALADGRVYTASQAVDNGLVDDIMGREDFFQYISECFSEDTVIYEPEVTTSYFASLFGAMEETKEKSDLEVLQELMEEEGSGVPLYVYPIQ